MTTPITARHARDCDGNPLIEIRAVGPRIFLDADQGATGRRIYPEEAA